MSGIFSRNNRNNTPIQVITQECRFPAVDLAACSLETNVPIFYNNDCIYLFPESTGFHVRNRIPAHPLKVLHHLLDFLCQLYNFFRLMFVGFHDKLENNVGVLYVVASSIWQYSLHLQELCRVSLLFCTAPYVPPYFINGNNQPIETWFNCTTCGFIIDNAH